MKTKYDKVGLEKAVSSSSNWREVCEIYGISIKGGNQTHLKNIAVNYGITFSHFNRDRVYHQPAVKKSVAEYLDKVGSIQSHKLKKKLIEEGIRKEECAICKIKEWMGEPVVFELDHIDSNHFNNVLSNLQILCPNCHRLETRKRATLKKQTFCKCGSRKSKKAITCKEYCDTSNKVKRSNYPNNLAELVFTKPFTELAKDFGVSDSAASDILLLKRNY